MFDLKKYVGVTLHDTEERCKIWRKTDLWFGKWHKEYGKLSPEHLKVLKLGLWWDPLIGSFLFFQSTKNMSLNFTEKLCVMAMKNDAKFEEELTWRIWLILTRVLKNQRKLLSNWLLWPKYMFRVVMFDDTEHWYTFNKTFYTSLTESLFLHLRYE